MKFPKKLEHQRQVLAKIYGKKPSYPFYRLAYRVNGKRKMESYPTYSAAKKRGDALVKELYKGSQVSALNAAQARDAIAAFERLEAYRTATGRRVSLLAAVSQFAESSTKLGVRTLGEAVDTFLNSLVNVTRKDITEAVNEFIALRKPLTVAKEGKRSQLSSGYAYNTGLWLRDFATTHPGTAVCDLAKDHLNLYMTSFSKQSPKSRNHYRGAIKMFLKWCVKRDYLSPAHRLFEADGMTHETVDMLEIDYYRPKELRAMLDTAQGKPDYKPLLPVIALGGLAGVRLEEILRLEWEDIWRVSGHIEITAQKSKTRARRLIEVCPALAAWLKPFRQCSGRIFENGHDTYHESMASLRAAKKIPARRNGLRHAFCTYHFAQHANENLTASQAGNTPTMIHGHYKGLATKTEAEKWFNVKPAKQGGKNDSKKEASNIIPLSSEKVA